ncbi:unnamed protein product [Mytilus coruscus]|uniref:Uncharacterized protein n=1 Tax=Mytilus coruscus TaxID=42192 RepID=A0A6J8C7W1_MYTCO|nr:unnamed protein product [Mytilus coruscus]
MRTSNPTQSKREDKRSRTEVMDQRYLDASSHTADALWTTNGKLCMLDIQDQCYDVTTTTRFVQAVAKVDPMDGILTQPCKLHQVFKRKVYMYDRGDYDSYRHQLSLVDWDILFITNDVDAIARAITDELIDMANKNIPNRTITVRKDKPPSLTADIKKMILDDPRESANNLNSDLAKIHRWSSNWLVTFNPQKTETMTILRKLHKPDHPKLNMDNNKQVETVKTIDFETLTKIMPKLQSFFAESIAQECIALISNAFNDQCEETDWKNTRICLVDGERSFHIVSGSGIHNWVLYTEDGIVDIVKSVRKQYIDEFVSVEVINKRVLGTLIIQYIGNEGAEVDARKHSLRKLFQATIDYIQTHSVPDIWENSTVTVYDSEDNTFKIKSDNRKNKFMVTEKKKRTDYQIYCKK